MCMGGGGGGVAKQVPPVTPAPKREDVARKVTAGSKSKTGVKDQTSIIKSVREAAVKDSRRQGIYGNVRTSRSGDFFYGSKTNEPPKYAAGDSMASFGTALTADEKLARFRSA